MWQLGYVVWSSRHRLLRQVTPRTRGLPGGLRGWDLAPHRSNLVEGSRNLAGLLPPEVRIFLGWELCLMTVVLPSPTWTVLSGTTRNGT